MSKPRQIQSLPVLNAQAAGINIGASFHVVAIPADAFNEPVPTFKALIGDIERMVYQYALSCYESES